jgi:hypothetical protein
MKRGEDGRVRVAVLQLKRGFVLTWQGRVPARDSQKEPFGTRPVGPDYDERLEIVSIGWNQYQHVHLWRKVVAGYGRGTGMSVAPAK